MTRENAIRQKQSAFRVAFPFYLQDLFYRIYRNFGNIRFLDKCGKMRYDCYTDYITGAKNEKNVPESKHMKKMGGYMIRKTKDGG